MKKTTIVAIAITAIAIAGVVSAAGGGYFWKSEKIADFQGEVKGVNIREETVAINLGSLNPGQWFTTEGYSMNVSHNCYGRIDATIWLENKPYGAIKNLWLSGNITNKDTRTITWYLGGDLMQRSIVIHNMPRNATINFRLDGTAGYPEEESFDLSNMYLKISLYPYTPPSGEMG